MPLLDVRDPQTRQLLFRYDPELEIVQIKPKNGNMREIHLPTFRERYDAQRETLVSTPEYQPLSTD
jgi:hypothetical protein